MRWVGGSSVALVPGGGAQLARHKYASHSLTPPPPPSSPHTARAGQSLRASNGDGSNDGNADSASELHSRIRELESERDGLMAELDRLRVAVGAGEGARGGGAVGRGGGVVAARVRELERELIEQREIAAKRIKALEERVKVAEGMSKRGVSAVHEVGAWWGCEGGGCG